MCGILGSITKLPLGPQGLFANALNALAHRGPDGQGVWEKTLYQHDKVAYVALGHTRLAIFDKTSAGYQPMLWMDKYVITYNGEIFNWPEIRIELARYGYEFKTRTDTEVLLAAYDYWGEQCVARFNGFWAFVILDLSDQSRPILFASRDRLGIKPLYVMCRESGFYFASEISPLYTLIQERPSICMPELYRFLVYDACHDSENTVYKEVKELEPGCNGRYEIFEGRWQVQRYWSLADHEGVCEYSDADALDQFSELIEDATRIRFRADREVALTLSGGIDSSVIACAAARIGAGNVRAFTSHHPNNKEIDEVEYASYMATRCGFQHVLVMPVLLNLAEEERKLTKHQELMYVSFSMLVNWAVLRSIKQHGVEVVLNGQGGDELFLGYERYLVPRILSCFPDIAAVFREVVGAGQNTKLGYAKLLFYLVYFSNRGLRGYRYRKDIEKVFQRKVLDDNAEMAKALPVNIQALQRQEICGEQLRRLLRYDDRSASAFGVEGRPVILDHRIVEFAYRLPWELKIRNGWTKYLLRLYLDRHGYAKVAWRRHKLGYNAPTRGWMEQVFNGRKDALLSMDIAKNILSPAFREYGYNNKLSFKVYNLLSTAREMEWIIEV